MKKIIAIIVAIIIIGGGIAAWQLTGNNSSNNNTSNNTTSNNQNAQAADKEQIRTNWATFFDGSTSAQKKIDLLQNGQQFAQVIQAQSQSKTAQQTSVAVSNVDVSGDTATVTYTIYEAGKAVLNNQKGQAVKVNGTWKVSDTAFCNLLQLSGTVPPNCPKSSNSSQSSGTSGNNTSTNTQTQSGGTSGNTQTQSNTTTQ